MRCATLLLQHPLAGRLSCLQHSSALLRLLGDLLEHEDQEVRSYVHGILYSILSLEHVREEARGMVRGEGREGEGRGGKGDGEGGEGRGGEGREGRSGGEGREGRGGEGRGMVREGRGGGW